MSAMTQDPLAALCAGVFGAPARPWTPAVDVFETENELVLQADLPGLEPGDIDVQVENQVLSLRGERKLPSRDGFHRLERGHGRFERRFAVPRAFDTDKIAAEYRNGVLTVKLAKKEAAKPRQIKIELN